MVEYFLVNRDFANDRFEGNDGKKNKQEKWNSLATMLNSMGGARKTVEQWQKYWADQRRETKKHAADLRIATQATGGGAPRVKPLTHLEESILDIINPIAAYGTPCVTEGGDLFVSKIIY